jgi:pimeloyl-ACP methyl ester carboxylesterase
MTAARTTSLTEAFAAHVEIADPLHRLAEAPRRGASPVTPPVRLAPVLAFVDELNRDRAAITETCRQAVLDAGRDETALDHAALVLWRRHDPCQKLAGGEKLAAPRRPARGRRGRAHWIVEEKPDEVAGRLLAFLDG